MKNSLKHLFFILFLISITSCIKIPESEKEEESSLPKDSISCHTITIETNVYEPSYEHYHYYFCYFGNWITEFSFQDSIFADTMKISGEGDNPQFTFEIKDIVFTAYSKINYSTIHSFEGYINILNTKYEIQQGIGYKNDDSISLKIKLTNSDDSLTLFINAKKIE